MANLSAAEARKLGIGTKPKAKRKYRNEPVVIDGIKFDSKAEGKRWCELVQLEKAGVIYNLRRQVWHELKSVNGAVACRYRSDFDYFDTSTGEPVTEDVKGIETRDFRLKAKLFRDQYGREIRVIRS